MRVMVLVKASEESEAGVMPTSDELNEMGKFNAELVKAGVMLVGGGLPSSAQGKRVRFGSKGTTVIDGPFAETKELVAGFWIWEVASLVEAVEWIKRSPFRDNETELRKVFDAEDFGDSLPAEVAAAEERMRAELAAK